MRQIIEVQLSETNPSPNSNFTIDVIYSTADPVDETLLGIALNLHYDSSALTLDLNDLSNVLQTSIFGNPQISADTDDLDSDPATDSILLLNWSDLNGNWPGVGTTPATLYTAEFTTSGDFAATTINFTAKTVPGFELDAQPVSIGAQVVNQAPTLNDATFSLAENSGVGTAVGTVMATDPDAGDTLTYSIGRLVLGESRGLKAE